MSEKEVAKYLRLNPRTLYRYRKSGKLPFHLVPGKTRPTIGYEQADVEALKRELERQRTQAAQPPNRPPSKTRRVSYGLPPADYQELEEEAAKYGMRVGEYARRLVREGLESQFRSEAAELRGEMKRLVKEIEGVRGEVKKNRDGLQTKKQSDMAASAKETSEQATTELRKSLEEMGKRVSQVGKEVQQSRQEFKNKFDEFAAGFEAILEFTGLSAEESSQWVNDNLR